MENLRLDIDLLFNNPQFRAACQRAANDIKGVTDTAQKETQRLNDGFGKLGATLAGVFTVAAAKSFVTEMINVRGEFQQLEIAFSTILQSKEKADALMKQVVDLAAKTPFSLQDAAQGAKQLLAYGTASGNVVDTLKMLGNVASGVSAPLNDIVYLYGTLQASGRVTQMDINQFAGRGIPIYQALADVMGKNTTEIRDLVSAGKVGFPEVQSAFERMTGAGGQFYNLMEAQSKSLTGQISNLGDAWDQMMNDIGKSQEGVLSGGISLLADMVENYETVLKVLGTLIATYGVYRAAMIANAVATSGMTAVELLHYGALVIAEKAQKALNITTLSNPYVAVAAALGALIAALVIFNDTSSAAQKYQKQLNEENKKAIELAEQRKQKYQELTAVLRDANQTEFEKNRIFKELQALYPTLFGNLTKEEFLKKSAAQAQRELNEANDQMKVDQVGKQFQEAQKRVESLTKAIENYKSGVEIAGNQGAGLPTKSDLKENLEAATAIAKQLGDEFERQQKELMLSKMTDAEKLGYYKQQKAEIEKQADFVKGLNRNATDAKNIFASWGIAGFNRQLDEANKQIDFLTGKLKGDGTPKNTLGVIDGKIKDKKDEQQNVSTRAEYLKIQKEINALEEQKTAITGKLNKVEQKQGNDRLDFLNKLADKEAEIRRKGVGENKSEVQKAQKEYAELRKQADKLKLGSGVKERINNAERTDIGYLKYDQQTEALEKQIEAQKQAYADFEEYKNTFGEAKAKERFAKQIDTEKTYLQYLENLNKEFQGKTSLSGSEEKRQQLVGQQMQDANNANQKMLDKQYADAYQAAMTFSQRKQQIDKEYQDLFLSLQRRQNGEVSKEQRANLERGKADAIEAAKSEALLKTEVYKKASQDVLDMTREQVKRELAALKALIDSGAITGEAKKRVEAEIGKLEFTLQIGTDEAKLNSLKQKLQATIAELNATDENGISLVNEDDFVRLKQQIAELKEQIDRLQNPTTGKTKSKFAQGLEDNFKYLKGSSKEVAEGVSSDLGRLSGSFNELSQAFGGADTQAGYLMGTIGDLAKVGSDAAGAFASFASGDIIGGVTKAISAVAGLFSIGKKVKEMNAKARKEVEDFYANAIAGERAYQELLKERALQTVRNNKTTLNGIGAELKLRQSQMADWKKESDEIMRKLQGMSFIASEEYKHGTWFRKAKVIKTYGSLSGMGFEQLSQLLAQGKLEGDAKALVERLKELEQKGYDAKQALAAMADEVNQLFTGTTVDGLTDSLLTMFREGKTGVQDMADFFESTMQDAALSIFKNKVLAEAMETFYKDFASASQDGLTDDKIANLKSLFNSLMNDANSQFDALKNVTGLDLGKTGKSNSSLTEAVKGITADQAGLLAGQFGGQRIATLEGNSLLRQGLDTSNSQLAELRRSTLIQIDIANNTKRTAENTDRLEAVEKSLKSIDNKMNSSNALRAAGG